MFFLLVLEVCSQIILFGFGWDESFKMDGMHDQKHRIKHEDFQRKVTSPPKTTRFLQASRSEKAAERIPHCELCINAWRQESKLVISWVQWIATPFFRTEQ